LDDDGEIITNKVSRSRCESNLDSTW